MVGGARSRLLGGNFREGFLSAGFTQAAGGRIGRFESFEGRLTAAAVVGGTASVIGGGKFANGAVTGAFSRLFNDESSIQEKRRLYDRVTTGDSEVRPITNWEYETVVSASDIPGIGTGKKLLDLALEIASALNVQLQHGTRVVQEQSPYDEYSYDVYVDGASYEAVTERFNQGYETSGWQGESKPWVEHNYRVCAGGGLVCTP